MYKTARKNLRNACKQVVKRYRNKSGYALSIDGDKLETSELISGVELSERYSKMRNKIAHGKKTSEEFYD